MDSNIDLEAQQQVPSRAPEEVGGSEIHVTSIPPSETKSGTTGAGLVSTDQQVEAEASLAVSQAAGDGESNLTKSHETDAQQYEPDIDAFLSSPVEIEPEKSPVEQTHTERRDDNQTIRPKPHDSGAEQEEQDIRMIGDFDGSANALWTLYRSEAKSYDEARIQTLKGDMDGVLIFAGLFSTVLTAFIIDSKQNLNAKPADQTVYYLQQNVAMLDQISRQISSIAPQFAIPSSPPPLYPHFSPSWSDIRVNVFWFMALVFSLSAALLATLVQQWVRDYMQVFQRYGDPLKSARLRQYLHDGCKKWYMPVAAEAVPGLLHVSLFLFFVGLCDAVLNINTAVGVGTAIPIGLCGILYVITTFAPVLYPQSPYQTSFSSLIWYLIQRLHGRTYKDRASDGALKSVSPNMSEGQMQLAMEATGERMVRDEEAIRWLIENSTEEAEMELFVVAIPGSFNAEWGIEVWRRVSEAVKEENKTTNGSEVVGTSTPNSMTLADRPSRRTTASRMNSLLYPLNALHSSVPATFQAENDARELCRRVAHLLETCKNRGLFASDEQWRKRTRACIEATASFVGCANAELGWFGDIGRLLGDIGKTEKTGELMSTGMDRSFVLRWTCLSLMSVRPMLSRNLSMPPVTNEVMRILSWLGEQEGTRDDKVWKNVQKVDDDFDKALNCLSTLFEALQRGETLTEEEVKEILRNHESQISDLERINAEADRLSDVDDWMEWLPRQMDNSTHGLTCQLPGLHTRFPTEPIPFNQVIDLFIDPLKFPLFFPPGRILKSLCSPASAFRDMLEGQDIGKTREALKNLNIIEKILGRRRPSRLLERQLWRLQDLSDGNGLGITVELFFTSLRQLLSTSLSQESQSALYVGTFRSIISDWNLYKQSPGTQKILLDAVASSDDIFSNFHFPAFITDELLVLLGNVLNKRTGPHIDNAVQQLRDSPPWFYPKGIGEFRAKALEVILQSQSEEPALPSS